MFRHDLKTGVTTRVSVGPGGRQTSGGTPSAGGSASGLSFRASVSGDGRYVVFVSPATNLVPGDTNGVGDGFVRDLKKGLTRRVTTGAGGRRANAAASWLGVVALDRDGDTAAFVSEASNLVAGDTNGKHEAFVVRLK